MLLNTIVFGLLFLSLEASAQVQCPSGIPGECECLEWFDLGLAYECIDVPLESWDIQQTFDAIADTVNNFSEVYRIVVSGAFILQKQEIPANSITSLNPVQLQVNSYFQFTRIDPNAFPGGHSSVEDLAIYQMQFSDVQEVFELVNNFKKIQFLDLGYGTTLAEIPANAFGADLVDLEYVYIEQTVLGAIGDFAFAALPNLKTVLVTDNDLRLTTLSDTAFNMVQQNDKTLYLERNPGIYYLPEEMFANFLNGSNNHVYVGCQSVGDCEQTDFLHCDERADWLCENYVDNVHGYWCKQNEYLNLEGYCEQKFGNSLVRKKYSSERKGDNVAPRMYKRTHHIEKQRLGEFARRTSS